MLGQSWDGLLHAFFIPQAFWDGKEVIAMDTFNFVDLYGFLQTALGMVLTFLGGRRSMKRNEKSRPSVKDNGSNTATK